MSEDLQELYLWIDEIPLSRPKRNLARDFSDGVLVAEAIAYEFPKLVDLHNYSPANSTPQKVYNWNTLNKKVFRKLGITVTKEEIDAIAQARPLAVEKVLWRIKKKVEERKMNPSSSSVTSGASSSSNALSFPGTTLPVTSVASGEYEKLLRIISKKDETILELQQHVQSLETRLSKLEQLLQLKELKDTKLAQKQPIQRVPRVPLNMRR